MKTSSSFAFYNIGATALWLMLSSFLLLEPISSHKTPLGLVGTDTPTRTAILYHKFINAKYPESKVPSIYIVDSEVNPVNNASIFYTYIGQTDFKTIVNNNRNDGIYLMDDLAPGIIRIEVSAPGFESQIQYAVVYPNSIFKKTIALGKPGDVYLPTFNGPFPLTNPSEIISFHIKSTGDFKNDSLLREQMSRSAKVELNRLRPYSDTIYQGMYNLNCLAWPSDSVKRSVFYKLINENDILATYLLYVDGNAISMGALVKYSEFWVLRDTDEKKIRESLARHGFEILRMHVDGVTPHPPFWRVRTTYNKPLSLDYLRDIQNLRTEIPLLRTTIDYLVKAKN